QMIERSHRDLQVMARVLPQHVMNEAHFLRRTATSVALVSSRVPLRVGVAGWTASAARIFVLTCLVRPSDLSGSVTDCPDLPDLPRTRRRDRRPSRGTFARATRGCRRSWS